MGLKKTEKHYGHDFEYWSISGIMINPKDEQAQVVMQLWRNRDAKKAGEDPLPVAPKVFNFGANQQGIPPFPFKDEELLKDGQSVMKLAYTEIKKSEPGFIDVLEEPQGGK